MAASGVSDAFDTSVASESHEVQELNGVEPAGGPEVNFVLREVNTRLYLARRKSE
jgi:hypothetical protein